MKLTDKPIPNPVVVLREEADEWAILFNPDTNDAVGINPVGVEIWKRVDGRSDVRTIGVSLANFFSDIPESSLDEVQAFLDDLVKTGFVTVET